MLAGAVFGAMLLIIAYQALSKRQAATQTLQPPKAPSPFEVTGPNLPDAALRLQATYAGVDRTPPKPPAPATPPPPTTAPPPMFPVAAAPTAPVVTTPVTQGKPVQTTPVQTVAAAQAPPPKPAAKAADSEDRLFAEIKTAKRSAAGAKSATPPGEGNGSRPGTRQSQLFPPAQWERPADPTKVLYASQILHGLTEQAIVTGESGTVRVRLTETVYDKFGQGRVLLPQGSLLLATVEGRVSHGQTRVPLAVTKIELPDGTDLPLTGKGGAADGAVGVPGDVDNRYPQVVLATLITAGLSVGARYVGGQPSGFQPTIEQDFARDVSQGFNASGQKVVERSITIQPIITVPVHAPVTVQLERNMSLQTAPRIVHR
jgi:type IV secretion system protein VirB10